MKGAALGMALGVSFAIGASVGAGVVYGAPHIGLRAVEKRLTKAEGVAIAQAGAREQEDDNRTIERADAGEDVTAERQRCDARIANLTALWSVRARPAGDTTPNEESPNESCSCADYGDIRPLDDWLSDAGLLDDG